MVIKAPIAIVFEWVSDFEQRRRWMEGVEDTVFAPPFDPAHPLGATFRQNIREGARVVEYDGEIIAWEPPTHFGVRLSNPDFTLDLDYRLSLQDEQATRLDYQVNTTYMSAFARVMGMLFMWLTRRIAYRQIARLRDLVESAAQESA
ncbi:MAG: hypothetical protein GX573_16505 [Chloroflexi bacterium]|nr:hypothetical protein [Chloroflexota bacterium]